MTTVINSFNVSNAAVGKFTFNWSLSGPTPQKINIIIYLDAAYSVIAYVFSTDSTTSTSGIQDFTVSSNSFTMGAGNPTLSNATQYYCQIYIIPVGLITYNAVIYLNNVTASSQPQNIPPANLAVYTTSILPANYSVSTTYYNNSIGSYYVNGSPSLYIAALVYNFSVYNRVLTYSELSNYFKFSNNLITYSSTFYNPLPIKLSSFYQTVADYPPYLYFDADSLNQQQGYYAGSSVAFWNNLGTDGIGAGTPVNAKGAFIGTGAGACLPILQQTGTANNNRYYVKITGTGTSSTGTGNFFTLPSMTFNFQNASSVPIAGMTIIAVVNFTATAANAAYERLIDFGTGSANNNICVSRRSTTQQLEFWATNGTTGYPGAGQIYSTSTILDATWRVYVIRYDTSNTSLMWYNSGSGGGTVINSVTSSSLATLTNRVLTGAHYTSSANANGNYIGRSNFGDNLANMNIGELLVYRQSLTESAINGIISVIEKRWNIDTSRTSLEFEMSQNLPTLPATDNIGKAMTSTVTPKMYKDPLRGYVMSLNGSTQYLNISGSYNIASTSPYSYTKMFWIYMNSLTGTTSHIMSSTNSSANGIHYIMFNNGTANMAAGHSAGSTTIIQYVADPQPMVSGIWAHYALAYEGGASASSGYAQYTMTLYRNGQNVSQVTNSSMVWTGGSANTGVTIGGYGGTVTGFNGYLDKIRIYSRALNQNDIQLIYNAEKLSIPMQIYTSYLYVPPPSASASGGTITQVGSYTIHTFLSSGTFTVLSSALACDILVVAGGGGGGGAVSAGGGGGGVQYFVNQNLAASAYTVTVGTGGAGAAGGSSSNGSNSQFGALTASVGGGGGQNNGTNGGIGVSGGSGSGSFTSTAAIGTPGQGYPGGTGVASGVYDSGGGGAGGPGGNSTTSISGAGGPGLSISISGTPTYYGGGGGGGSFGSVPAYGGIGGGGNGGYTGVLPTAGMANSGGGGGGAGGVNPGANGGSGIVIVRYLTVAMPLYIMDYVSAIANARGLFACKRLLTSYTGPIITLSKGITNGSPTQDFYADANGNLATALTGGTTYTSWASTNSIIFAPVVKWWDQSGAGNHATAVFGSWPVYDPYNNLLDFSTLAGSYGGNSSGNNFMTLPNGTIPSGSSPTFTITARHGKRDTTQNNTILFTGIPGNNTISMSMCPSTNTPANAYFMNTWGTNPITAANTVEVGNVVTFAYNGSSVTQYIKGVSVNTASVTLNVSSSNNAIGYVPTQGQYINGQINFISIFNSVLSAIDQSIVESQGNYFDPYYYNTVLLLHGDTQVSSITTTTTIVDSSFYNATMTAANGASIAVAPSSTYPYTNKTFGNALYFPGFIGQNQMNGYQITTPACSGLYDFSGNNFTIECWVYNTNGNTVNWYGIMGNYQNNNSPPVSGCWRMYVDNTTLNCDFAVGTTNYNVTSTFNKNTWYHLAVVRNGSNLILYINGVNVSSTTITGNLNISNNTINIGWGGSWDGSWVGYIDDVRITNGVARYTTNFNVPMASFSAIEAVLPVATGGVVSGPVAISGSSYMIHQFLQTGTSTFTLNKTSVCDILVVAGGGGAGQSPVGGGGGGGGGVQYMTNITLQPGTYTITVGSGGLGGGGSSGVPTQGGNSSFGSLCTSTGGGYGAYSTSGGTYIAAGTGGSGGGGISTMTAGGQPIYGQGYIGGTYSSGDTGGGGGGAAGAGGGSGNSLGTNGNDGGPGAASSITGITLYYGGGGGGGNNSTTGLGGIGGGGGSLRTTSGGNGIANTGGGGQAQGLNGISGNGGSGIVIVRYVVTTPIATITNPSVEFTTSPSSGWSGGLMSNASGITCIGWTFTGTAGAATILNPSITPATYGSVGAKDGVNVIYISSNASTAIGNIANLVIGSVYIVSLWVLSPPIAGSNGGNAFTATVNTSSATTTIYSSSAITNVTTWTQIKCQPFIATSTTHTITLAGTIASKSVMIDALTIAISTNPMIINPSLEATTPIAPTSWQVSYNARIPPGTACAGWTVNGTGASIVNNNIQSTNWGPATSDGNAVIILSVYGPSSPYPTPTAYGTITNLTIGVSYIVYMSITNRNVASTGGIFTALVNTTPTSTTIYSPTSITWTSWQYKTCTSFTATSNIHTLTLQATASISLDSSICVDSITVAIPRSTPASPTLLGYWDFTNTSNYNGSSVTDLSTNGVNLTWMGGGTPSYTTTGAMCANLTDNISYLQSNTEAPWGGSVLTGGFTFECLVKVTSLSTSTSFPSLMGYGGATSSPYLNIVSGNGGGWYWGAATYTNTYSEWSYNGPSPINSQPSTTTWSHLVFVCKPTGNQSIIYLNGTAVSILGGSGTNISIGPDKLFYIGTCAVNGATGLAPTRTGKIYLAMARMYSGILPATGTVSVATNYNQYKNMSGNPYAI